MSISETIASLKERIESTNQKIEQSRNAIHSYNVNILGEEYRIKSYQKYRDKLCKQLGKYIENLESEGTKK